MRYIELNTPYINVHVQGALLPELFYVLQMVIYRKKGMLLNTFTGIVGALLMSLAIEANSYEMVIIGRFVIGFTSGKSNNDTK